MRRPKRFPILLRISAKLSWRFTSPYQSIIYFLCVRTRERESIEKFIRIRHSRHFSICPRALLGFGLRNEICWLSSCFSYLSIYLSFSYSYTHVGQSALFRVSRALVTISPIAIESRTMQLSHYLLHIISDDTN